MVSPARQQRGFLKVTKAVGDNAGGHHNQEVAGHREEHGEVNAHSPAIDQVAQHHGHHQATDHPGGDSWRGFFYSRAHGRPNK